MMSAIDPEELARLNLPVEESKLSGDGGGLGHFLIPLLCPDQLLPSPLACPLRCLKGKPTCFDVSHNNAEISFNLNR